MSELVLERLGTKDPRSILKEVSDNGDTRRAVAALAPIVMDAAEKQDRVAQRIVNGAVMEAVKLVAAVAKALAKARINTATTISAHSTRLLQNEQDYKSLQADYKSLEQRVTALEDAQKPGNN